MIQAPIDPARAVRGVPVEIAAWIKTKGRAFDPSIIDATRDLYLALHRRLPRPAVEFRPDLAYGPDLRHRLDLHLPALRSHTPWPVVIFFHGGGFVGGEKNAAGRLIHGNVADTFACNGMIGINATYRLAPTAKWPEAARDVSAALAWARANIGTYGGDPQRIVAMGQSAGAPCRDVCLSRRPATGCGPGPGGRDPDVLPVCSGGGQGQPQRPSIFR